MSRHYAFVTLVTSDAYLPGALAVAAALREVHPSPPSEPEVPFRTVCLVTPETVDVKTIKHLRRAFDLVIGVEVIEAQTAVELQLLGRPDLHSVLTKLHVFRLTQFDKIIFLDADVLPVRPLSHLFHLRHDFSAVPDVGWPDIFNTGLMVLTPGEEKFKEITHIAKTKGSWDGGDQGVLNEWRGSDWNRLSFTYNTTPTAAYTYAPAYERFGSQISAIHFIGENKPWNEIPYRAPTSAFQAVQQQEKSRQALALKQTSAESQTQKVASISAVPPQSYAYSALVDRWFDVYDRNYRQSIPLVQGDFEAGKYKNVWDDSSGGRQGTAEGGALGLEDLRRLALQGGTSTSHPSGEGVYRSLPLEGRVDLMRPKQDLQKAHPTGESPGTTLRSEEHIRTPTMERPHWLGDASFDEQHVSTPGPNEVPPSPLLAPLPLPPSGPVSPVHIPHSLPHDYQVQHGHSVPYSAPQSDPQDPGSASTVRQLRDFATSHEGTRQDPESQGDEDKEHQNYQTRVRHYPPPGEPRRHPSPPLVSWNPAIEPPPNVPPTSSAFPADAYFQNAWDLPSNPRGAGSTSISSQFFQPPPQAQIPQQLIREGHYEDVTGPQEDRFPRSDVSRVASIFPWEEKPRRMPGRRFPEGEHPPPGSLYIENMPPTEPEQESEILTPDTAQEEKVQVASPQTHFPSPPIGYPGARGFANAWDSVPSIQKYAARLVKPAVIAPSLTIAPPRIRRRTDSYRSRSEQSDANSMDGDVEDEIDDNDSETDAGGRFSSSERSSVGSRRSSRAGIISPPSGPGRFRVGKLEYRSYGVQTVPKDVRSVAVQVSEEFSTSTGQSSSKETPKPDPATITSATMPRIELPKQPPVLAGPEPSALSTPSASVASFIRSPSGRQQQFVTPSGMVSPRLQEPYTVPSPIHTPQSASPGTQTPVSQRQVEKMKLSLLSTESLRPDPSLVVRTSSQETADSPLWRVSPVDTPFDQPRKPTGRKWNPATGVDVFKRSSEEVLARFLRLGSWEDDTQSPAHTHA